MPTIIHQVTQTFYQGTGDNITFSNITLKSLIAEQHHGDVYVNVYPPPAKKESFTPTHFHYNLPAFNPNFTGRTELLKKLNHEFELNTLQKSTKPIVLTAFYGLGGIGKTELAKAFIYQHRKDYQGIYWLSADNEEAVRNSFLSLAKELNLGVIDKQEKPEDVINRVKRWLAENPNYLMVFDNAPNYPAIQDYIPNQGHVMVTSRYKEWNKTTIFLIKQFTPEESKEYIQKILQQDSERQDKPEDIEDLAELLGHLPLALAQACAYIKSNVIDISQYQELYAESKKSLLNDKTLQENDRQEHEPVWITWDITMQQIKKTSPLAVKLLHLCAYLHPSEIPQSLLKKIELANPQNELFEKTLGLLNQYSMLTINPQVKTVSMHPLVKEVLMLKRSPESQIQDISSLSDAIGEIYPYQRKEMASYQTLKNLLPHLESLVQIVTTLLPKSIQSLILPAAAPLLKETKKSKIEVNEPSLNLKELPLFVLIWLRFAQLLAEGNDALGLTQEAKQLWESRLKIQESHYGKDHIETANTLGNLANAIKVLGNTQSAKTLNERALKIKESHYGKDHIETASTLGNLASAIYALGDVQGAKVFYERALKIKESHYGKDHIETANTLSNLANAIKVLGDAQGAKTLYEHALKIKESYFGKDHIQTAATLMNLANTIDALGDAREAKILLEHTLNIQESHFGKDHIQTAATLMNLANAIYALGDAQGAKVFYERALKIKESHYGKDHIETAATLGNLANAIYALGDVQSAKMIYERSLKIQESHYGKDHIETATNLMNLANAIDTLGDVRGTKTLYEHAIKLQESASRKDYTQTATNLDLANDIGALGGVRSTKTLDGHVKLYEHAFEPQRYIYDLEDVRGTKTLYEHAVKPQSIKYPIKFDFDLNFDFSENPAQETNNFGNNVFGLGVGAAELYEETASSEWHHLLEPQSQINSSSELSQPFWAKWFSFLSSDSSDTKPNEKPLGQPVTYDLSANALLPFYQWLLHYPSSFWWQKEMKLNLDKIQTLISEMEVIEKYYQMLKYRKGRTVVKLHWFDEPINQLEQKYNSLLDELTHILNKGTITRYQLSSLPGRFEAIKQNINELNHSIDQATKNKRALKAEMKKQNHPKDEIPDSFIDIYANHGFYALPKNSTEQNYLLSNTDLTKKRFLP